MIVMAVCGFLIGYLFSQEKLKSAYILLLSCIVILIISRSLVSAEKSSLLQQRVDLEYILNTKSNDRKYSVFYDYELLYEVNTYNAQIKYFETLYDNIFIGSFIPSFNDDMYIKLEEYDVGG